MGRLWVALPFARSTAVVTLLTAALGFISVLSRPSYEAALAFGLLVPPITSISTALATAQPWSGRLEARLLDSLRRAVAHALIVTVLLSLHALRVGWCAPGSDLALLTLGPSLGIVTAAFWGTASGLLVGQLKPRRCSNGLIVSLALLGPILGILVSLVRFYDSPSVFAFDQFVGFFAGSPYDTGFDPTSRLLSYRAGTFGLWLFLWAISRHIERDISGRLCWRRLLERNALGGIQAGPELDPAACILGFMGVGLFVAITIRGEPLGHRSSTAWIRTNLGQNLTIGRCELIYGATQKRLQIERLATDCNAWLVRLERRLGTEPLNQVTVYVFDSPTQKELLMGAALTQIAKPWRREIYLNGATYPDDVVGHELAHVVGGQAARGPFRIAGSLGGWLPNPGLIEGLAVALAPDEDGDLTPLELAHALRSAGKLPALSQLFSLGFLGHSGPVAYSVAGAFVDWLGQNFGKRAVRQWYGGASLKEATGQSVDELSQQFLARLDQVRLPDASRAAALAKLTRPGVYSRRCPHAVDAALAQASLRLAAGDLPSARKLYTEANRLDPTEVRARFGLGACAERAARSSDEWQQAEAEYRMIADDAGLPVPVRQQALERIADLRLAAGRPEAAQDLYQQLAAAIPDFDRQRSLAVKLAAKTKSGIDAVRALLLPADGDSAWDLAVRELLKWSNESASDGLPDYLLGRNYWQKAREAAAVEHLDRAIARGIQQNAVFAEALRLRAVAACALGDSTRAIAIADQLANETALPTPRRLGILRIVERCAKRPVGDDWPENEAPKPVTTSGGLRGPQSANAIDEAMPASANTSLPGARGDVTSGALPRGRLTYDSDAFDCPDGMQKIVGSEFWMGSRYGSSSPDESPRFLTKIRGFCLDRTEVTVSAYRRCEERGLCGPIRDELTNCNVHHADRGSYPINCVDYSQAEAYCGSVDERLPTELEWEFAARGGARALKYPWGDASPDGRACWKSHSSCPVASYPPGAFGLHDMTGNVWEWTSSEYGEYPWETPISGTAQQKVYRGGGWSRRFEKWMRVSLRNRLAPKLEGSHLGFRCAKTVESLECPFDKTPAGVCSRGVLDVECPTGQVWNQYRCAKPSEPNCPDGFHAEVGQGCLRDRPILLKHRELDVETVARKRSVEFDKDCQQNQPTRPIAYRYSGGTHEARNVASRNAGCKNRDVGVGWNSTCCPR